MLLKFEGYRPQQDSFLHLPYFGICQADKTILLLQARQQQAIIRMMSSLFS